MPGIGAVLVAYRSSAVIGEAITGLRREAEAAGTTIEIVVVDHSEDGNEACALEAMGPDRLLCRPNRGYAAGINAGLRALDTPVVVLANPDTKPAAGALGRLLTALAGGWDVVGPQFTCGGLLLPPADPQTPRELVRRARATSSQARWRAYMRGEALRCRNVWQASAPAAVPSLSGAFLVTRREALERVGPWDEGFFLYFEETDWLRRAAGAGLRLAVVPDALVEHRWGHATGPDATVSHFPSSRRRYYRKHFGLFGLLATRWPSGDFDPAAATPPPGTVPVQRVLWLVSPAGQGYPAAGLSGDGTWPTEALYLFSGHPLHGTLVVTAVDEDDGDIVGCWRWRRDG